VLLPLESTSGSVLPILTYDERKLSPSFGYFFDARWLAPCESIVGILWKFARMNALPGPTVTRQLRSSPFDPYEGIAPRVTDVDVRGLSRTLGVTQKALRISLGRSVGANQPGPCLSYCHRCIALGFHSVVHQRLGATRCPIHGDGLEQACRACGYVSAYWLHAHLLDAPFRCARCRRPYGRLAFGRSGPRPSPAAMRTAVTRAYFLS